MRLKTMSARENQTFGISAAILVGGKGTRLRPLTFFVPKPMVNINGKPFIDHLLERLATIGVRKCVLLTGYKSRIVEKHCGSGKKYGLCISYSKEDEKNPLGTGGALLAARARLQSTTLVMNGDTWVEYDFPGLLTFHRKKCALITINIIFGPLESRGKITVGKDGKVSQFNEKQGSGHGLFNTGVYIVEKKALNLLAKAVKEKRLPRSFSLETEGFPLIMEKNGLYAHASKGRFVDIGTARSLVEAHRIMP